MTRPLDDPRLGAHLGHHFYDRLATVQTPTTTRGTAGSRQVAYADDPARTELPARLSPVNGSEVKKDDQLLSRQTHRIGFQEDVDLTTTERVRIDDDFYDVLLVQPDSAQHTTYVDVEVVV